MKIDVTFPTVTMRSPKFITGELLTIKNNKRSPNHIVMVVDHSGMNIDEEKYFSGIPLTYITEEEPGTVSIFHKHHFEPLPKGTKITITV